MNEEYFRLYVGSKMASYRTMDEAKKAAMSFLESKPELRIEIMIDIKIGEADWWAYNYKTGEWEPS